MESIKISTLIIGLTLGMGCSKKASDMSGTKIIDGKTISDRPQNITQVVTLIRLKNPALFSNAKNTDGKVVIDEDLKKSIIAEQKAFLEKLKAISTEIKVLYTYKFTLNGMALITPTAHLPAIEAMSAVSSLVKEEKFFRLQTSEGTKSSDKKFDLTSVDFISASKVHNELGLKGKGMKVGILDTGIDYTHSMFLGAGTPEAYKAVNPDTPNDLFPNDKVAGGYDFVGTEYSAGSDIPHQRIPKPDMNPLDEAGHGTHVAGTVAGLGDNTNTYSGVAPEADLYALKVFGKNGSTSDAVVIAAMEYAADPNQDLDPSDKLDVINLSLGGGFGKPYIMYDLAVKNLSKGGVVTVASAGNSGNNPYIVGAPSTANEAISVAASIDGMEQNWKFKTVEFTAPAGELLYGELVEGTISKPVSESQDVKGKLVHVGDASVEFTEEQKKLLNGNIALIDRGKVNFIVKLKRAQEAKAIGVIVANNKAGEPIRMGGTPDDKVEIPAVMITQALGDNLKKFMKSGDVLLNFKSEKLIEKPQLIDTLTGFTSRGPRSLDGLIKPEIAAPGFNIISAEMGKGSKGVALNGTSMSAPHMAGVMALLKERFPKLSVPEMKAIILNTAKMISDDKKNDYSVTMQGTGRVQTFKALTTDIMVLPATLSLGETDLVTSKVMKKKITVKNISNVKKVFTFSSKESEGMRIALPKAIELEANSSKVVTVSFLLENKKSKETTRQIEGRVFVQDGEKVIANIPALAVVNIISKVSVEKVHVLAEQSEDSAHAAIEILLSNKGKNQGPALLFNSLGTDKRKLDQGRNNIVKSKTCDLKAAGYKIVQKDDTHIMQIAVKLYNSVSRWNECEISVQFDTDGDKVADQELAGINAGILSGLANRLPGGFYSVLLDASKARAIRAKHELDVMNPDHKDSVNYIPAVLDVKTMKVFNHSSVAYVEVDLSRLKLKDDGQMSIKIGTLSDSGVEADDFLGEDKWITVSSELMGQSVLELPEEVVIKPGKKLSIDAVKGEGKHPLMILFPHNRSSRLYSRNEDRQYWSQSLFEAI